MAGVAILRRPIVRKSRSVKISAAILTALILVASCSGSDEADAPINPDGPPLAFGLSLLCVPVSEAGVEFLASPTVIPFELVGRLDSLRMISDDPAANDIPALHVLEGMGGGGTALLGDSGIVTQPLEELVIESGSGQVVIALQVAADRALEVHYTGLEYRHEGTTYRSPGDFTMLVVPSCADR